MTEFLKDMSFSFFMLLVVSGFLFGVFFTYTHFLALKYYVFKQKHLKSSLFILTFIRLFIFGFVLWLVINIHQNVVDVLIFFVAFICARWLTFLKTKRMLKDGKNL